MYKHSRLIDDDDRDPQRPPVANTSPRTRYIQKGDILSQIAQRKGITGNALLFGGLGATALSLGGGGATHLMGGDPQYGRRFIVGGAVGAVAGAGVDVLQAVLRAARERDESDD